MLLQTLKHIPSCVPFIFVALVALGISQLKTREVPARRIVIGMTCLQVYALWGLFSVFHSLWAGLCWLAGMALCEVLSHRWRLRQGLSFDRDSPRVRMPGSRWLLALFMAIFAIKFAVSLSLGLHAALAENVVFIGVVGLIYGAFGGFFLPPVRLVLTA